MVNQAAARFWRSPLALALVLAYGLPLRGESGDAPTYKTGYSSIMRLGKDIYSALKGPHKDQISPQPIAIETGATPSVRLRYQEDDPKPERGVWISEGFIDLVNNVAHAKAIDRKEKGYFARYIELLSQETGGTLLRPLPNDTNPKYWTDEMLNEQQSNFNSIVGIVVATKLAHHYLGQHDKYRSQLAGAGGRPASINNVLTPEEWEQAFKTGLRNALEAGCMIEGVIPFFEAFDKMKSRPEWTAYFLPDHIKFARLKKDIERIQRRFLQGQD